MTRNRDERGLLTTELAMLMPIMLSFALLAVFVLQVERHDSRAQQAADAAARAASLTRSPADAESAARQAAEAVCFGPVVIHSTTFSAPNLDDFIPGSVGVHLSCTEPFNGFEPLVDDQSRTEEAFAVAAIEYWLGSP